MITVVVGPPCGGKSTFVSKSAVAGDVVVDFDRIAQALGADGHLPDGSLKLAAFAARAAVLDLVLAGIEVDAWVIHTSPSPELVAKYRAAGARFELIAPSVDECLKRAEADGRPAGTEQIIRDWFESPPDIGNEKQKLPTGSFFMPKRGGHMLIKEIPIKVKAGPDDGLSDGQFTAYASTFTRKPDSYGDVVAKGAFVDTLKEWAESGNILPVLFGHRFDDPDYNIGGVVDAKEDDHGLLVTGQLDLDNPKALQVYRLLKGKRIGQMSFAYDVQDSAELESEGQKFTELRKLKLYEVSVVPVGANQDTSIVAVKSTVDALTEGMKAGRVLAQKHIDSLQKAYESIGAVLAAASESELEKANEKPIVKVEELETVKVEEQKVMTSALKSLMTQMKLNDLKEVME